MTDKEPRIVCLMCNFAFCKSENLVPSNINVARVNCIGEIDPTVVLEIFERGADAVMLAGCKPPDCHFVEGNLQAERAVKILKKLLALTGLEPERLSLLWYSPLEATSFTRSAREFSKEIEKLGASPLKNANRESTPMVNLLAAKNAAGEFVKASLDGVTEAAASAKTMPADFRVSITNAPGKTAYPICSFTWLLIPSKIDDAAKRTAITGFLKWMIGDGQKYAEALSYAQLPKAVVSKLAHETATVNNSIDRVTFTHVESDVAFPLPQPLGLIDAYVVYVGFDPRQAFGDAFVGHGVVERGELLHLVFGIPGDALAAVADLRHQRPERGKTLVEIGIVALDHCDCGHRPAGDGLHLAFLPFLDVERLRDFARRVVQDRGQN
jgi:coenzyme F420-reducing hydrogenase delta subunit